jgi:hypothetical protein
MNLKDKGAWCGCSEPQWNCRSGTAEVELNNVHTYEVEHFAEQGNNISNCSTEIEVKALLTWVLAYFFVLHSLFICKVRTHVL